MEKSDEFFMEQALIEAKKAFKQKEVPIGAVIVCKGEIIGRGYNKRESENDPTAHAEMIAIKKAAKRLKDWRLEGCSIYVTVEPCLMCAGAIQKARIKRLIYGTESKKDGASGTLLNILQDQRLNHQVEIQTKVKEKECKELLKKFFNKLRNGRMGESG